MKTSRKLLVLVLALVMVFACAVPAFADPVTYPASYTQPCAYNHLDDPDDPNDAFVPEVPSTGFHVTLNIMSYKRGTKVMLHYGIDVELFPSDCTAIEDANHVNHYVCYVGDVLRKAATDNSSWLTFHNSNGPLSGGPQDYVYGISDSTLNNNNAVYAPVLAINYYNGWRFRINDMFPLLNSVDYPAVGPDFNPTYDVPYGAGIEEAFIDPYRTGGNVIDLYFSDTLSTSYPTTMIKVKGHSATTTSLVLDVFKSKDYYTPTYVGNKLYRPWTIESFTQLTSFTGYPTTPVVKIDGHTKGKAFNNDGQLVINLGDYTLSPGEHTIEILPTYKSYSYNGVSYYIPYSTGCYYTFTL